MELREKVSCFLEDTGATVTNFCKKTNISPTYFYKWMKRDIEFSDTIKSRIVKFLEDVYAK